MKRIKVEDIVKAVQGRLVQGSPEAFIEGVTTDSRNARPDEIFFALKGPSFDGHAFVKDVFARGVGAAVVESVDGLSGIDPALNVIVVKDTLLALGALASFVRGLYRIPFVAVSGSAGKTTTKEMIASILGVSRRVLKTEGNKNNLIGLPLTLFGLGPSHEAAVVELGISEPWEMERLVSMCRPDIGLITNIGRGHLSSLGSMEGVAKAKGPLFTMLPAHGVKVVNLDDPWVVKAAGAKGEAVTYSLKEKADVRVEGYSFTEGFSGLKAAYNVGGRKLEVGFSATGVANVINGAAAIAATLALGVRLPDMKEGLAAYSPVKGRMGILRIGGLTVLDDTYNANPESMGSALKTLKEAAGRKVAVLGDMLELGAAAAAEHRSIGRLAGELGIDIVVAIGNSSDYVADGARGAGVESVFNFNDKNEALKALKAVLSEGDSVLVKGSRGMALEEVVEGIRKGFAGGAS